MYIHKFFTTLCRNRLNLEQIFLALKFIESWKVKHYNCNPNFPLCLFKSVSQRTMNCMRKKILLDMDTGTDDAQVRKFSFYFYVFIVNSWMFCWMKRVISKCNIGNLPNLANFVKLTWKKNMNGLETTLILVLVCNEHKSLSLSVLSGFTFLCLRWILKTTLSFQLRHKCFLTPNVNSVLKNNGLCKFRTFGRRKWLVRDRTYFPKCRKRYILLKTRLIDLNPCILSTSVSVWVLGICCS